MTLRNIFQSLFVVASLTLVFAVVWKRAHTPTPGAAVPAVPGPQAAKPVDSQGNTPAMPRNMQLPAQAEIRPVYPAVLTGEPDPRAKDYCVAIHELPAQKRAACCSGTPGTVLTADCTRVLTYALRNKAVNLSVESVQQCTAAMQQSLQDCAWVGFLQPQLPAACIAALQGALPAGARCRSSLECAAALRCQGAGPTELGTCTSPLPSGQRCATGVDALAAYTRFDQLDRQHPECRGFCGRTHVCQDPLPLGAECVMSAQCGSSNRCGAGQCVAGTFGQLGAPCVGGDCATGLRCAKLKCIQPAAAGAACDNDFDCQGGCLRKPGQSATTPGQCGPRCT